uniref:Uncharacterized protein n=1 Tax=Myriodontium keratinophilum bipartite virus 1 TaxID=2485921 RepID=A0A3G3C4Q0_9VIRU|nr:hypothetical protein [Myriodontium keratinophilum bipartite virus 1]
MSEGQVPMVGIEEEDKGGEGRLGAVSVAASHGEGVEEGEIVGREEGEGGKGDEEGPVHGYADWLFTPVETIVEEDWEMDLEEGPMELVAELGLRTPSYPDLEHRARWYITEEKDVEREGPPNKGENKIAEWAMLTILEEGLVYVNEAEKVMREMGVMAVAGYCAACWLAGDAMDMEVLRTAATPRAQTYHALVAGKSAVDAKHHSLVAKE